MKKNPFGVHEVIEKAAYEVAHDYLPRGASGLAEKIGINEGTFLNQVRPDQITHKLSLTSAVDMTIASGDARILINFANVCGFMIAKNPKQIINDDALVDYLLSRDKEMGEFSNAIAKANSDGVISEQEFKKIGLFAKSC